METANLCCFRQDGSQERGSRRILTAIVYGEEVKTLAADMEKIAVERKIERWSQQAERNKNLEVRRSNRGTGDEKVCNQLRGCGYESCDALKKREKLGQDFRGPDVYFQKRWTWNRSILSAVEDASLLTSITHFLPNRAAAKRLNTSEQA